MIKKYINSYGKTVKIYDTNEIRTLDKVFCQYSMYPNIWDMADIIRNKKIPKEKYGEVFLKKIYSQDEQEYIYSKEELGF